MLTFGKERAVPGETHSLPRYASAFTPRFAHFRAVFDNVGDMRNGKGRNVKITGDGK